ncbi:MAG: hypothetical protein LBG45_01510 [Dysgonamonadaceae bacterium]|jgi:hypothetical protein|nr:hypothetical protein [Dysgonamonadaceae bacterium]
MADIDSYPDNRMVNTDIFVVVENEENDYDFVTVDEGLPSVPIIIDMSDDEFAEAITVDFEENTGSDDFVTIDEDPIFISGFTENDDL